MKGFIAAVTAGAFCVFLHFIVIAFGIIKIRFDFRMHKYVKHLRLLIAIWVLGLPVFMVLYNSGFLERLAGLFSGWTGVFNFSYGMLFFAALLFYYLAVYYIVDRSVSSRLMIEIERSPGKRLTLGQIRGIYDVETKYNNELKGMLEGGFIRKEGDVYKAALKGILVGMIAGCYKRVFRLGKGG